MPELSNNIYRLFVSEHLLYHLKKGDFLERPEIYYCDCEVGDRYRKFLALTGIKGNPHEKRGI